MGNNLSYLLPKLHKIGNPFLVEFEVEFDLISESRKRMISNHFLEWKMMKEKWEPNAIFQSEALVNSRILPSQITNLISLDSTKEIF